MTTNDVIRKLKLGRTGRCRVCNMMRVVEYEDLEVGIVCEPCMAELREVDIMLNCDLAIGICRPVISA